MKKSVIAVLAALLITTCVGLGIFAVGGAALLNKNSSPDLNAETQVTNVSQQTDQVAQLQSLVAQYQDREQELQDQLTQMNAQLQQSQQTVQQAQALLEALQQRGLISISNDGRIFITQ